MNMREEIRTLTADYETKNKAVTAEAVVEAAKDAEQYPALHDHLWAVSTETLATEARVARAHRLLISIRIVTEEGDSVRLLTHVPGMVGYQPSSRVAANIDMASLKLAQLTADIARSRARLREFKALLPTMIAEEIDDSLARAEQASATAATANQSDAA